MLKGNLTTFNSPFTQLGSDHPAGSGSSTNQTDNLQAQLTQVLSNRALNEVKVGYAGYGFTETNLTTWSNHPLASRGITNGHPRIQFTGFNIAGNNNWPRYWYQNSYNLRDDFTWSYELRRPPRREGGRRVHVVEVHLRQLHELHGPHRRAQRSAAERGAACRRGSRIRSTWTPGTSTRIANITRRYVVGISDSFPVAFSQPKYGAWWQDDWRVDRAAHAEPWSALRPDLRMRSTTTWSSCR